MCFFWSWAIQEYCNESLKKYRNNCTLWKLFSWWHYWEFPVCNVSLNVNCILKQKVELSLMFFCCLDVSAWPLGLIVIRHLMKHGWLTSCTWQLYIINYTVVSTSQLYKECIREKTLQGPLHRSYKALVLMKKIKGKCLL